MEGAPTPLVNRLVLPDKTEFSLAPATPFHFDGTFHKPSHFPDGLSAWEPGKYWQAIRAGRRLLGLKVEDRTAAGNPSLRVSIYHDGPISEGEIDAVRREITWRFDLDADLSEFNRLAKADRRFFPVFKKWLGMRNSTAHDLYGLLIVAVVLQNTTVRRSVQMLSALLAHYGTGIEFDGREVFAFWLPEDLAGVSEQELRGLKIGYRAKFLKRLSQDFAEGKADDHRIRGLDRESAKTELMTLYGVGPETARILLFEACHQYDTFDHIAPWQQKIYSRLFYKRPVVPVDLIRDDVTSRYGTYSMLAVHYIWEDIFWRRKNEKIDWLEKEIRL